MGEPALKLEYYDVVVRNVEAKGKPYAVVAIPNQLLPSATPFEIQIPWEIKAMAAGKGILEQALPVGIAAVVGAAIVAVFAWGFSMLHGDLGDLRKETHDDIGELRSDIRDTSKQIASVATQQSMTNQKLDDLIGVAREKQKGY